jgi:hypothetical protein
MAQGCARKAASEFYSEMLAHWTSRGTAKCARLSLRQFGLLLAVLLMSANAGCHVLTPKPIAAERYFICDEQLEATQPVMERGKEMPILDTVGWIFGIPSKIILWDSRADRHHISPETEQV